MGIVEVRGAGILSGFNNFAVYSAAETEHSEFFGFLCDEVREYAGVNLKKIMDRYNGYTMGSFKVINPWSFMSFLKYSELKNYWLSTSYVETLSTVLSPHVGTILIPALELICETEQNVPVLVPQVNDTKINWHLSSILHFLVHAGYLTYRRDPSNSACGLVSIPNGEILSHWKSEFIPLMKQYIETKFNNEFRERLRKAVIEFDVQTVELTMKQMLMHCSFHDLASTKSRSQLENAYHMFFFGAFFAIFHDGSATFVTTNRESGHGRYDIRIELRDHLKVALFELKKSTNPELLNDDAQKGLQQAIENQYDFDMQSYDRLFMGVSFYKKQMSQIQPEKRSRGA